MDKTYTVDPDIIWKEVDGIVYILQPEREEIHALNETGTYIWKLLSKGYSLQKVQTKLLTDYAVTAQEAKQDIQAFVERYIREKFLIPHKKKLNLKKR